MKNLKDELNAKQKYQKLYEELQKNFDEKNK